jgi:predicted transcriptional regulator
MNGQVLKMKVPQAETFNRYARRLRNSRKAPRAFEVMKELARSPNCFEIYGTILDLDKPFMAYDLLDEGFSEATIYRALKKLREFGLIACVGIVRPSHHWGGPRPAIWVAV